MNLILVLFLFALSPAAAGVVDASPTRTGLYDPDRSLTTSSPPATWVIKGGGLVLDTPEGAPRSRLQYIGAGGELLKLWTPTRTINFQVDAAGACAAWYDGASIQLLDPAGDTLTKWAGSHVFALGENGLLAAQVVEQGRCFLLLGDRKLLLPARVRDLCWQEGVLWIASEHGLTRFDGEEFVAIPTVAGCLLRFETTGNRPRLVTRLAGRDGDWLLRYELRAAAAPAEVSRERIPPSIARSESREHEAIPYPLEGVPGPHHPVGNSYGELQQYGGEPYLHPGVDLLGEANEQVRAVKPGVVKAVLTTGGSLYWRVAVGAAGADSLQGYLYAHLNQASLTVAVGDSVQAGDVLGTLVSWPVADFTHLHFARIGDSGPTWDGDWWTLDDPLRDIILLEDDGAPVFEECFPGELFAFRDAPGSYQDPVQLSGPLQIITHVHDLCNSDWRLDVSTLEWELFSFGLPVPGHSGSALPRDLPLDVYGSGLVSTALLQSMYVRDDVFWSLGNYDDREYYSILTSDDGDGIFQATDSLQRFQTQLLPDGDYELRVRATDARGNEASAAMTITLVNGNRVTDLALAVIGTDVQLSWSPPAVAESFRVEKWMDASWLVLGQTQQGSWLDAGAVQPSTLALYRVIALLPVSGSGP